MQATVTVGAIAPHGDIAVLEACTEETRTLATATQAAMAEMARRLVASRPETVVVATPHNVHVVGHMAVITAARVEGTLEDTEVRLSCPVDRELAVASADAMNDAGVPTVAVSFGGNAAEESAAPMDWGALVPLWPLARLAPEVPCVVVAPARDLDAGAHVRAGGAIVRAARSIGRRVAFIASADQGHGHRADGPYGFAAESAAFDERVTGIVGRGALAELVAFDPADVHAALADSWWQMLMLHGALEEEGGGFDAEVLAYEAPTYYGMLTAVFRRRPAGS